MARELQPNERLVQIGQTALRAPDGSFLPAQPLYVVVSASEVIPETEMSKGEGECLADVAGIFAEKFGRYVKDTRALNA